jgi:hypothetical protein
VYGPKRACKIRGKPTQGTAWPHNWSPSLISWFNRHCDTNRVDLDGSRNQVWGWRKHERHLVGLGGPGGACSHLLALT